MVFKKENHQSIYEYPKENALSPTYSEPQTTWSQYLANSSPYSSSTSDSYMTDNDSNNGASYVDFNALDGFAVSSSSRPFHGSQFNAECHTWPTDSEFSWSQVQVNIFYFFQFSINFKKKKNKTNNLVIHVSILFAG